MTTVRMFCDWGHDSSHLVNLLMSQTLSSSSNPNSFGNVTFVDGDDYDYAVVFNFAIDGVSVPPERRIGLVLEPVEILDFMYPNWRAFDTTAASTYYSFTPLLGYELASGVGFATAPAHHTYPVERCKRACMVVSNKVYTAYQRKRRDVLDALLASGAEIDFYGRGMPLTGDPRVKGEIAPMEKFKVFSDYEMVIDFENDPEAVTDKFFDAAICGCTPITNSKAVDGSEFYRIDFGCGTDVIVDEILRAIEVGPLDTGNLKAEVVSGKLSLAKWINDKVSEIESSNSWT